MVRTIKAGLALTALAGAFLLQPSLYAQDSMKQDEMKHDQMQDDKAMHDVKAKTLETGKFHGKVHATSGRATVYQEADGKLILRLTNFKTSNGPDVHVILFTASVSMRTSGRRRWRSFRDSKGREGESGRSHCPIFS